MQPVGNERPPNLPGRPAGSPFPPPPQGSSPFQSPPLVASGLAAPVPLAATPFSSLGPVPAGFRSPSGATPQPADVATPFPALQVGYGSPPLPPPPTTRFNGPSSPPPPTYAQPQGPPKFPSAAQPIAPLRGPPPVGQASSITGSFHPSQPVPGMGAPPQSVTQLATTTTLQQQLPESPFLSTRPLPQPHAFPRSHMPPIRSDSHLQAPKMTPQLPLQTFPLAHAPPVHASVPHPQQGLMPPPPPVGAPLGLHSREQLRYPNTGPPIAGGIPGLVEEFQSLSIGSTPGSLDLGIDINSLPRPLSGDQEPTKILDIYPMNCHPRFLRLTTHAIPSSQSLLSRWHLPLGAVVHPLAQPPDGEEVPVVNFGTAGIIRCRRCRTYINPYVSFTDAGRKWRCNLCSLLNDVPGEYYCALDATGRRCDADQRPELCKGSVEFVAPTEYMVRPPMPPTYFFLIDVSASAVRSGLLEVIGKTIKSCLDDLPGFPRTQIGFITYDSTLHFHNLKSSLTQPQMLVVADLDDVFLPLPDDLLVNLSDSRHLADSFLDSLPNMFQLTANQESAFGPALKAAFMVMGNIGGKLLVFQSTLPSLGVGRLRLRGEDLRVYGTDKEHTLRIPEDPFYKQMAAELTKNQIAVDIYGFSEKYSDIASLGTLAKYTGGQVYHYPFFQASVHQEKLSYDLSRDLKRETTWEAVMRIRCGKGVRFTTYHGHFMLRSTDLLALPAVDCDKAFAVQLSLEETLMTTQTVYFQVALLHTSSSGERRIRVHTAAAPVVADLGEMYRQADTGAVIGLLSRIAIENTLSHKLEEARQSLQLKLVKSLKEYRNLYVVHHRLGGRLIFPESLRYLPLYVLAICKSIALRGGYADAPLDDRCAAGYNMMILPVSKMLKLLYPSLYRIDENLLKGSHDTDEPLNQLALTAQSLDPKAIYVFDDGFKFIIWFGRMVSSDLINNIIGIDLASFPDLSRVVLYERESGESKKLMRILRKLREQEPYSYQLCCPLRQGEQPREGALLLSNLIEDQTFGTSGYFEWILQIYRQSQS